MMKQKILTNFLRVKKKIERKGKRYIVENNNLLNIKLKNDNSSSSSSSSLTSFSSSTLSFILTVLNYHSLRDFSNVNPDFRDELNLELQQLSLLLLSNQKTLL
jgi:hypothetical protein